MAGAGGAQRLCKVLVGLGVIELERTAAAEMDGTGALDLSDLLCLGAICSPTMGAHVAYRDSNHLTASASANLAPDLLFRLEKFVPRIQPSSF